MELKLTIALTPEEFYSYNWVLALERPIVQFFIYTVALLILASLFGLWPGAQLYALAAALPLAAYLLTVWLGARRLWRRYPEIAAERRYHFDDQGYHVSQGSRSQRLRYTELARVLESRSAIYLIRSGGGADILPKRVADLAPLRALLLDKVADYRHARWL